MTQGLNPTPENLKEMLTMPLMRRLAIIESEWWRGYSHTVRPIFEAMSQIVSDQSSPDRFHYERFVGRESLVETLSFVVRKRNVRYLYLATHGSTSSLLCPNETEMKRSELEVLLEEVNEGTRIDGVLLGTCLFGNKSTAGRLLRSSVAASQRVKWVAGYTDEVDWFNATLLDAFFLRHILEVEASSSASGRSPSPSACLYEAVDATNSEMGSLARHLQFHVYAREKGTGEIIDILAKRAAPDTAELEI